MALKFKEQVKTDKEENFDNKFFDHLMSIRDREELLQQNLKEVMHPRFCKSNPAVNL